MNALISELKSEALKERHWERLTRELRVSWNQSDLTLGDLKLRLFMLKICF